MRRLIFASTMMAAFAASPVTAQERAFGLDGAVYKLNPDKTYEQLAPDNTDGRIVFTIMRARDSGKECELAATLKNRSAHTVRYLKQCFKVYSQKGGDTVCFTFGGGRQSQSIGPQASSDALGNFDKGACSEIVGAAPYYFFNGRDPSSVSVDGLAAFEARQLFTFPDTGVVKISN